MAEKCYGNAVELNEKQNCNFTQFFNHSKEILYQNGSEIGLYEVDGKENKAKVKEIFLNKSVLF